MKLLETKVNSKPVSMSKVTLNNGLEVQTSATAVAVELSGIRRQVRCFNVVVRLFAVLNEFLQEYRARQCDNT